MTIRVQFLDPGGLFRRKAPLIRRTVAEAVEYVQSVSDLSDVDVIVHPADHGPDQFLISSFTSNPHHIDLGIERSQLSSEELESELFRVAVHELHHAKRMRAFSRWTVGESVILEGLALLADHVASGPQDEVDRPLANVQEAVDYVLAHRNEPLAGHRNWLYSPEPEQPGAVHRVYTVGHLLMTGALKRLDLNAWEAADLPAEQLLAPGFAEQGRAVA
ncbi:DUF2268 domain-containing putative Zn-dependent protease [Jannaschia aquimarina]|uniref:DUF2268 domain-containing protein n=1 Tax=Jannaschia aquimarina TaxID=935700 RepID=A0A0D1CIU7_9RHOB|nr:DUF2268 domain-containing putative Zn-dependent protease [Jannaschia aquimarina]KIT14647.1 hypothetical protein jaqu_35890 [Jannaschia aquimarina]SNT37623.1 Predicted Zn-dependent protease [Jannaschia aquimarina]